MRGGRGSRSDGSIRGAVESRYWREPDARAVLDELGASGLGIQAFCRRYGVGRERVRYWQRRLAASEGVAEAPVFLPVRVVTPRITVADGSVVDPLLRAACQLRAACHQRGRLCQPSAGGGHVPRRDAGSRALSGSPRAAGSRPRHAGP